MHLLRSLYAWVVIHVNTLSEPGHLLWYYIWIYCAATAAAAAVTPSTIRLSMKA
jgi:hypothetical protein